MKKSSPLFERTAEQIVEYIKSEKLIPGDKLPTEFELVELLDVGRSTIREAIKSLESRNILTIRQGSGTFISSEMGVSDDPFGLSLLEWSGKLALDLIDVRLLLEPEIAARVAISGTIDQKQKIIDKCQIVEDLINRDMYYLNEDMAFHQSIAESSGNQIFDKLIPIIHSSISKNIDATENKLAKNTIVSHREISETIMKGDHIGARNAMIAHLHDNRLEIIREYKL